LYFGVSKKRKKYSIENIINIIIIIIIIIPIYTKRLDPRNSTVSVSSYQLAQLSYSS